MSEVPASLAAIDLPAVVRRYRDGVSLRDLAKEFGANWRQLYLFMFMEKREEYQQAKRESFVCRLADADLALDIAVNKIDIARAREVCRYVRMDMERTCPDIYSPAPTAVNSTTIIVDRSCGTQPIDITGKAVNGSE